MAGEISTDADAHINGLLAWWALAGVDGCVSEQPVNWLRAALTPAVAPAARVIAPSVATQGFPDTLAAFHDYLATATDLPETAWPGHRVMPTGPHSPPLMLIVNAPDPMAEAENAHFTQAAMRLVERMLRAIGLDLPQCYIASLNLVSPPGGMVAPAAMELLVRRMRRHISLVAPHSVLLLGDQTSRALTPTGGPDEAKNLSSVNHDAGSVSAISVIHPRIMLNQPSAKAGAWRALGQLRGERGQ